jgi:hypothetical protein
VVKDEDRVKGWEYRKAVGEEHGTELGPKVRWSRTKRERRAKNTERKQGKNQERRQGEGREIQK